jgi:arsenite methyltransferase
MSQLAFDEKIAAQLEEVYRRRDILRRRAIVGKALSASPGERVADVGCGPGFYVLELLEQVGPEGAVVGLDASPQMLAVAGRRCQGHQNVSFLEADATSLPLGDGGFDAVLTVQVLEYVDDVDAALAELLRVLRPGGRLVAWAVDWATLSLHSTDPERTRRVLHAWDDHLAHRSLPRTLAPRLRATGFGDVAMTAHAFATAEFTPEAYGVSLLPLMRDYVAGRAGVSEVEAQAWEADMRELGGRDEFYFACIQYCFTARRPDA